MMGKRLALLRREMGLTQQELSKELGISKDSISNYERDLVNPSDDVKANLARYFNVSADYLIGTIDSQEPLTRTQLNLPRTFSSDWIPELEQFCDFLVYYNNFTEEEKRFVAKWSKLSQAKREAILKLMDNEE